VHGARGLFQSTHRQIPRARWQGVYGFLFAAQVRVDRRTTLVVDEYSSMVMKFDRRARRVSARRKPENIQNPGGRVGEAPVAADRRAGAP